MLKGKKCPNCKEKMKNSYNFCPNCGYKDNEKIQKNYGMIGLDDKVQGMPTQIKLPMGLNMIFNSLMKNLNAEMQNMNQNLTKDLNNQKIPKMKGISISISPGKNMPKNLELLNQENKIQQEPTKVLHKSKSFSKKSKENFTKLEKEEPKTNIRRLGDKIIYELELPKINSIDEISFNKLENSIEIKAASNDIAYEKIIKIDLPISNYELKNEKLTLELEAK